MLRIAHRGAPGYEPENTLRSVKKALDLSVDMIEFDVYALPDKSVVVMHDDKVDRTTNGKGYVIEKTLPEIKQLDAGKGEKIPTLQEVIDLVDHKVLVNIELKGEKTAHIVADIITSYVEHKHWRYDDFIVSSFNHHELHTFKKLLPQVKISALVAHIPLNYAEFGEELGAYSVNLDMDFINQAFVDDAHKRGLKVFVYTVNDHDDIARMKALGVDGIFGNFPDRI